MSPNRSPKDVPILHVKESRVRVDSAALCRYLMRCSPSQKAKVLAAVRAKLSGVY